MEASITRPPRIGLGERLSYGCGDFGYSIAYNMASGFLLFYYVNVIGLPPGPVGVIFLIARSFDGVVDVLVGIAVDRTQTRWGRTRPYFLLTALPFAAISVAVFAVPDWSRAWQLAYAFVTFKLLGILMSCGSIPFTALMPMMTRDPHERLQLSGMRSIGTSVSVVLGTAATMPLVGLLGGEHPAAGFTRVAALYAALSLLAVLTVFRNCRERLAAPVPPRMNLRVAVGEMLTNRAWLVCFAFCLVYFIRFGAMMAITTYFAIEVLHRPWMISVMLPAVAGMLLLSSFIAPAFLGRFGIRRGCTLLLVAALVFFVVLPLFEATPVLFLAIYIAACLATSMTITGAFAMIAETIDHHEARFGTRREGLLSSGISVATKVGMALGSAGVAFLLGASGYVPGAINTGAHLAIRVGYYAVPIVLIALQILVIAAWPRSNDTHP